nr:PREDICTED: homeodomain-interacting protein kinase 1-like [Paralichthys olivaceus]
MSSTMSSTLSSTLSSTVSTNPKLNTVNVAKNDIIYNNTSGYVVMDIHGKGCFGKVAKCFNLDTAEIVAIKCQIADDEIVSKELKILKAISVLDSDKKNIVKFQNSFKHKHLSCIVFEMLDLSLHDLMQKRNWLPLSLNEIRPVVHQLLVSLEALKSLGIIHGDLKIDNVMLVNHKDKPFKIRLIDFGLAIPASDVKVGMPMQNPLFRAPEVMLGLPLTEAVDIWSLGCLMLFLYVTDSPFPHDCMYGWMKNLVDLVGQPADHLLAAGKYTKLFFTKKKKIGWRLMTPEEFKKKHHQEPDESKSVYNAFEKNLEKKTVAEQDQLEQKDKMAFFDLLKCCLQVDAKQRITPSEALRHQFITLVHMVDEMETSSYANTAFELMIVSPLDNLEVSSVNTVTNEESTSIFSSTGAAAVIPPVDADFVKAVPYEPFMKGHCRASKLFCRMAKRLLHPFKLCMQKSKDAES